MCFNCHHYISYDAIAPVVGKSTNFVGLDYDAHEGYIYYSEVRKDLIYRRKADGSGKSYLLC